MWLDLGQMHGWLGQAALNMIASTAPDDPRARIAALETLNHPSSFMRREALQALIDITRLPAADLARMKDMENDPDKDVARWSEIARRNVRLLPARRTRRCFHHRQRVSDLGSSEPPPPNKPEWNLVPQRAMIDLSRGVSRNVEALNAPNCKNRALCF